MAVFVGDLDFLRLPVEVSLGTGLRKRIELLRLEELTSISVRDRFSFPIGAGDGDVLND